MNFLITQIKEQKILEMEVALEDFLEQNNISESAVIHTLIFDKEVFADGIEVREYLKDKYFYEPTITEESDKFIASIIPASQTDQETKVEVELRRGVVAIAADLLPVMSFDEVQFNEKGEVNLSSKFGTINLHNGLPHIIEIARVAEGEHPAYGKLQITEQHLDSMESNFKSGVTGVDLAVNEDHKKNEAFGWLKDVFRSYDGQTLFAQVVWNTKGTTALSEKEYRYFSPEFRFNYVHPHTGVEHGPTLLGGALTNYPFLKMSAITELSNKNDKQGELPVSNETIDLSVHNQTVVDLNSKITEANAKVDAAESQVVELNSKVKELEGQIEKSKKETVHQKLFTENKINKAQLVALNEGQSMLEVLALNETMNTDAAGSDETPAETIELSSKEKEMAEKLGLTEEEYAQYNK